MTEREFALEVVKKLQGAGFQALWAGGCVRDELLGLVPSDYDVATNAQPHQLPALFRRRNEIGAHFGVVQVIGPRDPAGEWLTVEVATFRIDGNYDPAGRKPDRVEYSTAEEDAKRRDFTINGMFFDPIRNELIDYVGGQADLKAGVLRAIGNAAFRFTEDKLRILRAARMASRFGLAIEEETRAAAIQFAPEIRIVSAERIADELRKMFVNPNRAIAIRLLQELELIEPILPEIATVSTQSGGQGDQEWSHRVRVIEGFAACPASVISFPLVLAALLQTLGVRKAELIADRLRLSTAEKSRIAWLIQEKESLCAASGLKPSRLYPLLIQPGIHELIALHRANARAEGRGENEFDYCERVLSEKPPETLDPEPIITGNDLIELGLKPGKVFKQLLDAAREAQLDGVLSSKPQAVDFVRRLLEPKGDPGIPPDGSGSPLRG